MYVRQIAVFDAQNFYFWKIAQYQWIEGSIWPTTNHQLIRLHDHVIVLCEIFQIVQSTKALQRFAVAP